VIAHRAEMSEAPQVSSQKKRLHRRRNMTKGMEKAGSTVSPPMMRADATRASGAGGESEDNVGRVGVWGGGTLCAAAGEDSMLLLHATPPHVAMRCTCPGLRRGEGP